MLKHHAVKILLYGWVTLRLYASLISARDDGLWTSCLGRFNPAKKPPPRIYLIIWVGPEDGLDPVAKRKIITCAGNRTVVVQPLASHIDWEIFQKHGLKSFLSHTKNFNMIQLQLLVYPEDLWSGLDNSLGIKIIPCHSVSILKFHPCR
jgi:hypothetical protein